MLQSVGRTSMPRLEQTAAWASEAEEQVPRATLIEFFKSEKRG
jgi:hypothetical protein